MSLSLAESIALMMWPTADYQLSETRLKCQSVNDSGELHKLKRHPSELNGLSRYVSDYDLVHFGVYTGGLNMIWMFIDPL